jgi:hypothetical protein
MMTTKSGGGKTHKDAPTDKPMAYGEEEIAGRLAEVATFFAWNHPGYASEQACSAMH